MQGKVAVITGGNGTLGSAFAKGLAQSGASVFILGRNEEKSKNKVAEMKQLGYDIQAVTCDVLNEEMVQAACDEILAKAGRIDILVNGAGGNKSGATVMPDQTIFDSSIKAFKEVFEFIGNSHTLIHLCKSNGGSRQWLHRQHILDGCLSTIN